MIGADDFLGGGGFTVESPQTAPELAVLTQDEFFGDGGVNIPQLEDRGFLDRFSEDIEKRAKLSTEIINLTQSGEQSTAEGVLQVAGKVGAGAILDFLGESLVSAGHGLSTITPDSIEKPAIDAITSAGREFLNTPVGQQGLEAVRAGLWLWEDFSNKNPRAARNIEAVVDIGLLAAPVKTKPSSLPIKPTIVGRVGDKLVKKGAAQSARQRASFVETLVAPKETAAVRKELVGRTDVDALGTKTTRPSPGELEMARDVAQVVGVSPSKTLQENYNVISKAVAAAAKVLESALKQHQVFFPRREFTKALDDTITRLADNPLIIGDAARTAERIVVKMKQIAKTKSTTGSGLLAARKELDAWVRSQKGPNIFDPNLENAMTIALKEIRQTTNGFLAKKATRVKVRDSLRFQSNLLRAMDNIAPKAADEASNALLRTWQNISRVLPMRGEFNQSMAVLFGVGGLGASAVFAPFFTKLALGGVGAYVGGKFLLGSGVKKGLGTFLKETDRAIKVATNPEMLKQLRADRALIFELSKQR